jgi:hypothetical protein
MSIWEDVVTTGLIGTDRRPVPDELPVGWGTKELDRAVDPAHAMLSLAARHRAATRAGGLLQSCPPGAVAPPSRMPVASHAAHEILVRLLSPPQVDLLNLWLAAAVRHDQRVSAAYWTPLAMLAARTTELDRTALAKGLGERGIWFVEQNPQWARLAKSLRSHAQDEIAPERDASGRDVTEEAVRAHPELILSAVTKWPSELTRAVLEIIASGQLQQRGVRYAATVGTRLPLQHYEQLRLAMHHITRREQSLTPAEGRSVREALLALERMVWLRMEMRSAFSGEPIMVRRLEIPPWDEVP